MIDLARVSKIYPSPAGPITVLRDLDLRVAAGESVAIVGPSGSGKTTILMCIAGFVAPTAGAILLDGKDITPLPPERRDFGMCSRATRCSRT